MDVGKLKASFIKAAELLERWLVLQVSSSELPPAAKVGPEVYLGSLILNPPLVYITGICFSHFGKCRQHSPAYASE